MIEITLAVLLALALFVIAPEFIVGLVRVALWLVMAGLAVGGVLALLVILGNI